MTNSKTKPLSKTMVAGLRYLGRTDNVVGLVDIRTRLALRDRRLAEEVGFSGRWILTDAGRAALEAATH